VTAHDGALALAQAFFQIRAGDPRRRRTSASTGRRRGPVHAGLGLGANWSTAQAIGIAWRSSPGCRNPRTMAQRLGTDFSGVRVHAEATPPADAPPGTPAWTSCQDVYLAVGQYGLGTADQRRLLAHELTHVAHQTGSDIGPPRRLMLRRPPPRPLPSGRRSPPVTRWAPGRPSSSLPHVQGHGLRPAESLCRRPRLLAGRSHAQAPAIGLRILSERSARMGLPTTWNSGVASPGWASSGPPFGTEVGLAGWYRAHSSGAWRPVSRGTGSRAPRPAAKEPIAHRLTSGSGCGGRDASVTCPRGDSPGTAHSHRVRSPGMPLACVFPGLRIHDLPSAVRTIAGSDFDARVRRLGAAGCLRATRRVNRESGRRGNHGPLQPAERQKNQRATAQAPRPPAGSTGMTRMTVLAVLRSTAGKRHRPTRVFGCDAKTKWEDEHANLCAKAESTSKTYIP
jgi:Domain of unknown function (DUF4157)